jgi:CRISPR/Cas system CSM-associated protein Csm3 (group 7 of RAMP superfamily)
MSDSQRILSIALAGYWRAGGGRSSGYHLDMVCERDANALPYLPARQLKGLMRQALARAEAWGWFAEQKLPPGPCTSFDELLFGSVSQQHQRSHTWPGMLFVGNATLDIPEQRFLAAPEQAALREQLFDQLFSTAIDATGSAQSGSLRGAEVALPVNLFARLTLELTALDGARREQQQQLLDSASVWQLIESVLSLLDAIGAGRTRGLGEARMVLLDAATEGV